MTKKTRIFSYLAIFAAVFLLGWSAGYVVSTTRPETIGVGVANVLKGADKNSEVVDLTRFWEVRDIIEAKYYEQSALDTQKMAFGAIKGLTSSLEDPYSVYMTPEESAEFSHDLNGELEGIGAELTVRNQMLTVENTLKESPAQKAGLMPGDVIFKIDGEVAAEKSLYDAISSIRGEKGSTVILTIIREGLKDSFDVEIMRDKVVVESVEKEDKGDGIWLVTVNQFSDDTAGEYEKALQEIKVIGLKGLILDLRYNGGGYLDGAVDVLSPLLAERSAVVSVKYRDEKLNQVYYSRGNGLMKDVPLVVLVNEGSASAAEIVAAAVKDLKRGVVMGEKTYGKGSVQEVDPLTDGSSLRLTVAKWFSPSGASIDEVGLEPDQVVELTEEDFEKKLDPQLDAAVKYLKSLR